MIVNFGSSEFFINKAIGWSLRDYSKTDPDWVISFLDRYKGELSGLSIREAKNIYNMMKRVFIVFLYSLSRVLAW